MTPSAWAMVQRHFGKAMALKPAEREQYLKTTCPDAEVRREVKSLLTEYDKDENFFGLYSSIGGKVLSHYEIQGRLGDGGTAIVYRARDRRLGRLVAIKVLDPFHVTDPASQKRLVREARHASSLNHPNIVTIHDTGHAKGIGYVVMEWVDGKTLDRLIPRKGWPVSEVLRYAAQIAQALEAAHQRGIVHGDLTPRNIMATNAGHVKLLDFGLARAAGETSRLKKNERVELFGTLAFMAPEIIRDKSRHRNLTSDVFSFGLILHQMLTGQHPFGSGRPVKVAQAICTREAKALPEAPGGSARFAHRYY